MVRTSTQQIRLKRARASRWMMVNPVLAEGEPGYETDTGKMKVGDGVTPWSGLTYVADGGGISQAVLTAHVESETPHPVYDEGPSLLLLYENAKV